MFGAIAGGIASALAGGAMSKLFGGGQKAASGGIQGDVLATDNNTVGMGDAGIKSAIQGSNRSEERFSRNAETDLVCRLLLEKKKNTLSFTIKNRAMPAINGVAFGGAETGDDLATSV